MGGCAHYAFSALGSQDDYNLNEFVAAMCTIAAEMELQQRAVSIPFASMVQVFVRTCAKCKANLIMRYFVVFAGLALAIFGMLSRFADKISHPKAAPMVSSAVAIQAAHQYPRTVTIQPDSRGHFQVEGRVDGRRIGFMVDTGASTIALTESDARRLGIHPSRSDFTTMVRTASGSVRAAPVTLNTVDVGGLVVRDVPALVMPDQTLSESLLGLSYLKKLKRFEYANSKLVLEQ